GSSLLKFSELQANSLHYYGQEINLDTSLFSVMNLMVNGLDFTISQGDTLTNPGFLAEDSVSKFDFIISHPPFRMRNYQKHLNPEGDPYQRWSREIGNDSYLDGAFLSHILASMAQNSR